MQEKIKTRQLLQFGKLDSIDKSINDGFKVVFPVEMYKSYQAYNSSSLNSKKSESANYADKSSTLYYQPIIDKEFDFVINPVVFEPVIQVMYEIKVRIKKEKKEKVQTSNKEYMIITPNGEVKYLNLK